MGALGTAVGLSFHDRQDSTAISGGTVVWAILTTCVALFTGGVVASTFTVGESKPEAMLYGVILWSVLCTAFLGMGALGVSVGFNSMLNLSPSNRSDPFRKWEQSASDAGVPVAPIDEWRVKTGGTTGRNPRLVPVETAPTLTATQMTWSAFAGLWLSMLAAAAGAVVGAGSTFRHHVFTSLSNGVTTRRGPGVSGTQSIQQPRAVAYTANLKNASSRSSG